MCNLKLFKSIYIKLKVGINKLQYRKYTFKKVFSMKYKDALRTWHFPL